MVTKIINEKRECLTAFKNRSCNETYCDSGTDDEHSYLDRLLKDDQNDRSIDGWENYTDIPAKKSAKKPKSILITHENEKVTKKPKCSRFVSFSVDDSKKPFTSSIYYGVKSYLHHFYEPVANKTTAGEDNLLEDDFEFVVEPGQRRRFHWFFPTILIGIFMLILAGCLLIFSNVTPMKNPIIGVENNLELLDQKAIVYNEKIKTWQFLGLVIFSGGGVVIMLALLISAYEQECGCCNAGNQMMYPSSADSSSWIRYAEGHFPVSCDNRIPLSEEVTAVQIEQTKN